MRIRLVVSPSTGERKTRMTRKGKRVYIHRHCARYPRGDHPRIRMTEAEFGERTVNGIPAV